MFSKNLSIGGWKEEMGTNYFMGMLTAFNSVRYRFILRRPSPSPRVCTDEGGSYGDVITKFSRLDGLPIFVTMMLRALKLRYHRSYERDLISDVRHSIP